MFETVYRAPLAFEQATLPALRHWCTWSHVRSRVPALAHHTVSRQGQSGEGFRCVPSGVVQAGCVAPGKVDRMAFLAR